MKKLILLPLFLSLVILVSLAKPLGAYALVLLNSATGKSCDTICENRELTCVGIGTDEGGTDGAYWFQTISWGLANCVNETVGAGCGTQMTKQNEPAFADRPCAGKNTMWTNCRCVPPDCGLFTGDECCYDPPVYKCSLSHLECNMDTRKCCAKKDTVVTRSSDCCSGYWDPTGELCLGGKTGGIINCCIDAPFPTPTSGAGCTSVGCSARVDKGTFKDTCRVISISCGTGEIPVTILVPGPTRGDCCSCYCGFVVTPPPGSTGEQFCTPDDPDSGINSALGCIPTNAQGFTPWLISRAIGIAGGIAFLLMVYAGFMIALAGGDPQKMQAGKELITAAISGLLLIIFAIFILRLIGVNILGIPGL